MRKIYCTLAEAAMYENPEDRQEMECQRPAALILAEVVAPVDVDGMFDPVSATWSNREFACAALKKHNEAM